MEVFDITDPRYNEHFSPVPWHFVKSRFPCTTVEFVEMRSEPFKECDWHMLSVEPSFLAPIRYSKMEKDSCARISFRFFGALAT